MIVVALGIAAVALSLIHAGIQVVRVAALPAPRG